VLAGDEIGLAVDLDHGCRASVGRALDHDHAFGGNACRLLVRLGQALLAHQLGRKVQVATGFHQCTLALHHAGAGALTQLSNRFRRYAHGYCQSCS
jgi:hypothetical protein